MKCLILPHIHIHNANALSSPFSIGFPAMTAWLGFCHALQRKLVQSGLTELSLNSVAVVCHHCDVQAYRGEGDLVHSLVGSGTPLDKNGVRSPFIEEARCHLDVSLIIEWRGHEEYVEHPRFAERLLSIIATMKVAGGDVLDLHPPTVVSVVETSDTVEL
ncbi:MAG: type I-F CRISPR-associated protein Csy2 [Vibrio fluvialis]